MLAALQQTHYQCEQIHVRHSRSATAVTCCKHTQVAQAVRGLVEVQKVFFGGLESPWTFQPRAPKVPLNASKCMKWYYPCKWKTVLITLVINTQSNLCCSAGCVTMQRGLSSHRTTWAKPCRRNRPWAASGQRAVCVFGLCLTQTQSDTVAHSWMFPVAVFTVDINSPHTPVKIPGCCDVNIKNRAVNRLKKIN